MTRLRIVREMKGRAQWSLAQEAEISGSLLCEFEKGRKTPSTGVAQKLADALGVPLEAIFPGLVQKGGDHAAAGAANR